MDPIAQLRCFNHADREAAARCPACHRCYCRECVTEHEGRVLCAACLKALSGQTDETRRRFLGLGKLVQAVAAFLVLWVLFYGVGRGLLALPASYHEDALWRADTSTLTSEDDE